MRCESGGVLGRVLCWLCVGLLLTAPVFAGEIEDDLGEVGAPSLGIYQVVYLATYVNRDPELTEGYQAIVDLDFARALPPLQKCLSRTRESNPLLASEAATFLGYCHLNLLQPSSAIDAENDALKLDPKNALAHFFLAQEYFIQSNRLLVRQHLEEAIKLHPGFLPALRMLAETDKDEGRGKDAIRLYSEIVRYVPNSGYYRYQEYRACVDADDYPQAERALKALMQIEPAFAINHYRLGDVYLDEMRFPEARGEYALLDSTPEFKYLEHLGFAKVEEQEGDLDAALQDARMADTLSHGTNEEAHTRLEHIQVGLRERTLTSVRTWIFRLGGLAVVFALVLVARMLRRREYLLAEIHRMNEELGRTRDQDELCAFLLDYFGALLGCQSGIVLLHNRFSNQLHAHASRHLEDDELSRVKVITSSDLGAWVEGLRKPLVKTAESGPEFEKLFPSLQQRLLKAGIQYLLVLRERDYFLGFIGVGGTGNSDGRLQAYDMLGPLLRTAARSMEAVMLYETSMVDETTGLYNKRYFKQALGTELRRADRYQQPCSLLTFDIDDFKKINDTYGHGQGDLVLRGIGDILRRNSREGIDTVARTGGEEFHLILPATSADRAVILAERVRTSIEEHRFEGFSKPVKVTVSLGLVTYPTHAADEQTLIRVCDEAQYQAKRAGKNRVVVAETKAGEKGTDRSAVPMIENRIDNLNIIDAPTGLFNFTYFSMRMREEFRRSARYQMPVSLLVLHLGGDHDDGTRSLFLKQLGVLVRESLREGIDVSTRLESGELGILVPETSPESAAKLAARLVEVVSNRLNPSLNVQLQISIGISSFPSHSARENDMLEAAVQAARKVAEMGANGIVIAAAVVSRQSSVVSQPPSVAVSPKPTDN